MKGAFRILFQIAKVAVALGLLYYLISSGRIDLNSLKLLLEPQTIFVGFACVTLILAVSSERWRVLLKQQNFQMTSLRAIQLTLIGNFFSLFVPGGVGGDVVKAVMIAQNHPQNRAKVALTVLADRIFGLFTMTFLALISFSFETQLFASDSSIQFVFLGLLVLFFGFILTFYLILSAKTGDLRHKVDALLVHRPRLHKLWTAAQSYHLTWKQVFHLVALSAVSQLTTILLFVFIASRLMTEVPSLSVFLFAVPVGFMVTAVPLAPGGIGVGQAAFLYLFSKAMGQESSIGAIGITAFQALQIVFGMIGALLFMVSKHQNARLEVDQDTKHPAS